MRTTTAVSFLSAAAAAAAMPTIEKRQEAAAAQVLIGQSMKITVAGFDGSSFETVAELEDGDMNPSWMLFKQPNHIYAVNEWANDTRHYTFDAATGEFSEPQKEDQAAGVVHLAFNQDETRMVGTSFADGSIDVWDISNSTLRFVKNIAPIVEETGPHENQVSPTAHQAVIDPTGRYFVVTDLGTDTLSIIDTQDDLYEIVETVSLDAGSGPRHGAFLPNDMYAVVTELTNQIELYQVLYDDSEAGVAFEHVQQISTLGDVEVPSNSTVGPFAGAIDVSEDGQHVYVSNRLIGSAEDTIAHFRLTEGCKRSGGRLVFEDSIPSAGVRPRMHSLGTDDSVLFSTNQDSGAAFAAFSRDATTGALAGEPIAVGPEVTDGEFTGPAFILQIA